jgi:ABC-type branched-subunit amino acid transport system substrate-binding protein
MRRDLGAGRWWLRLPLLAALIASFALFAAACGGDDDEDEGTGGDNTPSATQPSGQTGPLKLGLLFPLTGDLSDFGPAFENAAMLAVGEINAAGGVNGQPIEVARGDDGTAVQQSVAEARRLVEIEGVNAIIGPAGSPMVLAVAESVTGPNEVLEVTSSATAPSLTLANDNDYLFRMPISDAAQGSVLADLAKEQSLDNICSLYVNTAYGKGLNDAFAAAFKDVGGTVTAQIPIEEQAATYASELGQCGDATTLLAISYPETAGIYLREALEGGRFENYLFVDGTKSDQLFAGLGWQNFEGSWGTAPGALNPRAQGAAFEAAYQAKYNSDPSQLPYLRETYDAVYAIALAAEAADSNDPTAIRDALRGVVNAPGTSISPGEDGWRAAVAALDGGGDIDYDGASSGLGLDDKGDVQQGAIEIWQIEGGAIVVKEVRPFDLTASSGG